MKSKREIEQFLTILELQEIMIPFFCPFRKLFVKKMDFIYQKLSL